MFPRRARLSRADIAALSSDRTAKRASTAHFSVVYTQNGLQSGVAVVISKKVEKSSVGRHLLKRRVLSVLKDSQVSSHGLIVYAREGSNTLSFTELATELHQLFERLLSTPTLSHS